MCFPSKAEEREIFSNEICMQEAGAHRRDYCDPEYSLLYAGAGPVGTGDGTACLLLSSHAKEMLSRRDTLLSAPGDAGHG